MNDPRPYNQNPELTAMKDDVASRHFNMTLKSGLITVATVAAGAAAGALAMPLVVTGGGAIAMGALIGGGAGLFAAAPITDVLLLKDRTKLKIDEEMVQSYMSGKNYWGEGYREEVAEHGYSLNSGLPPARKEQSLKR